MEYTKINKGDGLVEFGSLCQGDITKLEWPKEDWNFMLTNYLLELGELNPDKRITLNWIDSPHSHQKRVGGAITIRATCRIYDAKLYTKEGALYE